MRGLPERARRQLRAFASRRGATTTAIVAGVAITAVVATVAVTSDGYKAQRLDLNGAAVWVVNGLEQAIGRANTQVLELDSVVAGSTSSLEVLQQGDQVVIHDRGESTLDIVDPATSRVVGTVPVPPESTSVFTTGPSVADGVTVISSGGTGETWILPSSQLDSFDAQLEPDLVFGPDSVASMDSDGRLVVYSPESNEMSRVDVVAGATVAETWSVDGPAPEDGFEVTTAAGEWALLDTTTRVLYREEADPVDLSDLIALDDEPRLQSPVAAREAGRGGADRILIASDAGLVEVPRGTADPQVLMAASGEAGPGLTTAPLVQDGCAWAAWPGGVVWTQCGTDAGDGTVSEVDGMDPSAQLAFAVSGNRVLLNDTRGGRSWAVQNGNAAIDNWADLLSRDEDTREQEENDEDVPPEYETVPQAPVALPDEFGARPGRSSILPVLLNDYDPNGDVLVITETTSLAADTGRLTLTGDRQQLLLELSDGATGALSFSYTITDGRGGTATASVTVAVRGDEENSPPVQVRTSKATVAAGGRATTQVLGDWFDPDGDAFFLTGASAAAPDSVTYKPSGEVVFVEAASSQGVTEVALAVSDGRADSAGALAMTVRPAGEVPIIAEPFAVLAYAGEEVLVEPLVHVRGGSAAIRLTNVPDKADVRIVPDYEGGTFRVSSAQIGTRYLDYTVSDGAVTTVGSVRVDVEAPPDPGSAPIAVPHTAFIREGTSQSVDVLATDVDPAGGVLLVTDVDASEAAGIRVELLEQRLLRVTLVEPLEGPVSFGYTLSNGLAETEGSVTVVQIPQPARLQPPIAVADRVSVRVGDAIDIPVLANDEQPDGESLTLDATLVTALPQGAGLLFTSQNRLRYLAPGQAGNYTAVYRVNGPDGQWATAEVQIAVREADGGANNPPVPQTLTARVLAGETVRIPIPLVGIDPDGDSVQLVGQQSSPEKGAVVEVGSDWIEFEAGDYSAGTDSFDYRVVDSLGAAATGTVRIGISPRAEGARNPVAIPDEVTVRHGTSVAIQVLANDSDPDGEELSLVSVESTGTAVAEVDGPLVRVEAQEVAGRYGFIYAIENERGGTSSNFLTVIVDPEAPLSRPVAEDTVLGLTDILDRTSLDVDVLRSVFFAEGSPRDLELSVLPGWADVASVTENKRIRVEIGDRSRIIPFSVSHPEDPGIVAYAFLRVPGFDDALPQLRTGLPRLTVVSGEPLTVDLDDYVVAVGGRGVRLTDPGLVRATHADGTALVVDEDTIRYRSVDRYFGPASLSFEVTDGASAGDPNGRRATLVLPITVTPRENQPPVFEGAVLDIEPGTDRVVDLERLTDYPYPDDADELAYALSGAVPAGFSLSVSGTELTVRADASTPKGSSASAVITVRDAEIIGSAGRVQLNVVASTRPLASPAPDSGIARRGSTSTIDVLANDQATNPFPDVPLRVAAVRGIDSASLPAGLEITPSADRSTLSVTASAGIAPQDVTLQYQVLDATGDPERGAWGTVTVSVQDRPDPVTGLRTTAFGDRRVTVDFAPGAFNNSPISGFQVTTYDASGAAIGTITCSSTTCDVPTPGNGPDNRIRVGVVAVNAIGSSDETRLTDAVWSDVVPAAPVALDARPLDHGLRVYWRKPAETGGSAITSYAVSVAGYTGTRFVNRSDAPGTEYSLDISNPAIGNGGAVEFTVSARNDSYGGLSNWNSARGSATPAGAPVAVASPGATTEEGGASGSVTVSWAGVFDGNGAGIQQYYAARYQGSPPSCSATGVGGFSPSPQVPAPSDTFRHMGGATSTTFTVNAGETNRFMVFAYNGQGCTSSGQLEATTRQAPGTPESPQVSGPRDDGQGRFDYRLDRVDYPSYGGTPSYAYRLDGGAAVGIRPGDTLAIGYGVTHTLQTQVCETWPGGTSLCSPWSPSSGPLLPVDTVPSGLVYDENAGAWSWTALPSGAYSSVEVSCDAGGSWQSLGTGAGSCTAPALSALQVRVGAGGTQYLSPLYPSIAY
ncbi:MAG: Ig-like domain-containing protein [Naasia sp.]